MVMPTASALPEGRIVTGALSAGGRGPLAPQREAALALQSRLGVSAEPCRDDFGLYRHRAGQPVGHERDLHFGDRQAEEAQRWAARLRPSRLVVRELTLDCKCQRLGPQRANGRLEENPVEATLRAKVLQQR